MRFLCIVYKRLSFNGQAEGEQFVHRGGCPLFRVSTMNQPMKDIASYNVYTPKSLMPALFFKTDYKNRLSTNGVRGRPIILSPGTSLTDT